MSLNKTLDRLFDEIRREAKRNPAFADRLDAALRAHLSRRDVNEELLEEAHCDEPPAPVATPVAGVKRGRKGGLPPSPSADVANEAPALNPVGYFKREGEAALAAALTACDAAGLRALIAEHNLDPSGQAGVLDREGLAAHILAQAKRRAERDEKMFDY